MSHTVVTDVPCIGSELRTAVIPIDAELDTQPNRIAGATNETSIR